MSTGLAAAVISFSSSFPANADLNKYEAEMRGEFGIGSAAQYGSADLRSFIYSVMSRPSVFPFFHITLTQIESELEFTICLLQESSSCE